MNLHETDPAARSLRRDGRSGNAFVEFALVFILLLTMIVGMFEFTWVLFLRATFHHAVREGVRYAITGNPGPSGLDSAIKQRIKQSAFGLLSDADLNNHVSIEFFDPACPSGATCPAGGAASAGQAAALAGSIVRVGINCYSLTPITNLVRKNPQTGAAFPFALTVTASDKMEPFPGAPPNRGTLAAPSACP
jgi:Flp pilus assembly protein TadG